MIAAERRGSIICRLVVIAFDAALALVQHLVLEILVGLHRIRLRVVGADLERRQEGVASVPPSE